MTPTTAVADALDEDTTAPATLPAGDEDPAARADTGRGRNRTSKPVHAAPTPAPPAPAAAPAGAPAVAPGPAAAASGARLDSQIAYLTRVLKMPTIGRTWADLADQARDLGWSHEEYLAAVLERQAADRESAGTMMRIRTAHFPAMKTLEDFNYDHLPSLRRDVLAHLATSTYVPKAENVVLLGPPGIGKTHLAIGLGIKAAQNGHSVLFDTASAWINRLTIAHQGGQLDAELKKIRATS